MTQEFSLLRIAFLHLAPIPGNLEYNHHCIEVGVKRAAELSVDWAILPELSTCGYTFASKIGTDWILPQPDPWMLSFCKFVGNLHINVFLSTPERDAQTGTLYNSVFVIREDGIIVGKHRKNITLQKGSEAWSSPGDGGKSVSVSSFARAGILICADAYFPTLAGQYKSQGANILVSAAAWAPGFHGPNGEWEQRTLETNLPLVVCNRTGVDGPLDFRESESVVAARGKRLCSLTAQWPTLFYLIIDVDSQTIHNIRSFRISL